MAQGHWQGSNKGVEDRIDKLVDPLKEISAQMRIIDERLKTVEHKAKHPEFRSWGFWLSVIAIVVSGMALLRDYFGLSI